jgi:small subunit ribosomal protein S8
MSQMNMNIAKVLKATGYINNHEVVKDENGHPMLKITLKYPDARRTVITDIKRVSKPGRRVYVSADKIPKVLNGFGISIISTSRGVMTDQEARESNVGGEILCKVW